MAREDAEEKKDMNADIESESNHAEPRVYELSFHIDADLPQEEAKKAYEALKDAISSNDGSLLAEGEPEKIQLAYTISRMEPAGRRDWDASFFGWLAYESTGEGHNAVIRTAGADGRIFRFLDVRTTKDAAKHSAEMHEFYRKAPEAHAEEEAADLELDTALKEAGVA
ncbi:30S ribosomal protein S6 [Patescibacteria group bacterium]|nr:30S ribosomal protein S6 [Patescibacteria group bacterium]